MDKTLYLYNSYGMKKMPFAPIREGEVSLYFCGPTVYSHPHVGNFRPVVVFDLLTRLLRYLGYKVTAVSNYTDVDDKIIKRATELGITEKELTEGLIHEYRKLVKAIGSENPDITPRPTECMDDIISYIRRLIEKGYAYEVDGDVYFRVRKIPSYGSLSNIKIEDLESGARISVGEKKEDPLDFALWKKTDKGIKWETEWSQGRPGWHTECCVMIDKVFHEQDGYIDIHGGGFDLKFPHHENEMAQSMAQNGNRLANFWVHNGFIDMGNEKMSKSLGNIVLMKDVIDEYGGLPFRLMVLSAHYRAPASFSPETMKESVTKCRQLSDTLRRTAILLQQNGFAVEKEAVSDKFLEPLLDDLNTPNALTVLYEDLKALNQLTRVKEKDWEAVEAAFSRLLGETRLLGLGFPIPVLSADDKRLIMEYNDAKERKDFLKSDELRALLIERNLF